MEAMSNFSFEVIYVPGTENILANTLSRIYANDSPEMRRNVTEYPQFDDNSLPDLEDPDFTEGFVTNLEAVAVTTQSRTGKLVRQDWSHLAEKDQWDDLEFLESLSKHHADDVEGGTTSAPPGQAESRLEIVNN
jgi:hypothetical protein